MTRLDKVLLGVTPSPRSGAEHDEYGHPNIPENFDNSSIHSAKGDHHSKQRRPAMNQKLSPSIRQNQDFSNPRRPTPFAGVPAEGFRRRLASHDFQRKAIEDFNAARCRDFTARGHSEETSGNREREKGRGSVRKQKRRAAARRNRSSEERWKRLQWELHQQRPKKTKGQNQYYYPQPAVAPFVTLPPVIDPTPLVPHHQLASSKETPSAIVAAPKGTGENKKGKSRRSTGEDKKGKSQVDSDDEGYPLFPEATTPVQWMRVKAQRARMAEEHLENVRISRASGKGLPQFPDVLRQPWMGPRVNLVDFTALQRRDDTRKEKKGTNWKSTSTQQPIAEPHPGHLTREEIEIARGRPSMHHSTLAMLELLRRQMPPADTASSSKGPIGTENTKGRSGIPFFRPDRTGKVSLKDKHDRLGTKMMTKNPRSVDIMSPIHYSPPPSASRSGARPKDRRRLSPIAARKANRMGIGPSWLRCAEAEDQTPSNLFETLQTPSSVLPPIAGAPSGEGVAPCDFFGNQTPRRTMATSYVAAQAHARGQQMSEDQEQLAMRGREEEADALKHRLTGRGGGVVGTVAPLERARLEGGTEVFRDGVEGTQERVGDATGMVPLGASLLAPGCSVPARRRALYGRGGTESGEPEVEGTTGDQRRPADDKSNPRYDMDNYCAGNW